MGERPAARLDEKRIDVPVIASLKLDDFIPAGESPRQPERRHGRFGSAVDHPHLFDRGNPAADQFCHFHFERIRNPEADAMRRGGADRFHDDGRSVAKNSRAPGPDVIDVLVAIDVPDFRAFGASDEEGLAAHSAKSADGGIHAAGNAVQGAAKEFG